MHERAEEPRTSHEPLSGVPAEGRVPEDVLAERHLEAQIGDDAALLPTDDLIVDLDEP